MKRFRIKAVGLGLALAAGTAVAADGDWHAPGQPPAAVEVITAGAPALLPPAMRAAPPKARTDAPIWVPARQPAALVVTPPVVSPAPVAPAVTTAGGLSEPVPVVPPVAAPVPTPQPQPIQSPPEPQPQPATPSVELPPAPVGPRAGGETLGPLPAIPLPPGTPEPPTAAPVIPQPLPATRPAAPAAPVASQPDPVPPPVPVEQKPKPVEPPPMLPPRAPQYLPPVWKGDPPTAPLPVPRPVEAPPAEQPQSQPQSQPELQPAPPALMIPDGALSVTKHGTFGSMPIRLSRDYPPLRDIIHHGHDHDEITIVRDGAGDGGPLTRYFVQGEYLLWWMPGFATPVLATTNANTALNGYLGEPGTTSLLGPGAFVGNTRSGFRVRAGAWLNDCGSCGIDAGFFFLGNKTASAAFNPDQTPLITRPVFAPNLIPGTNTVLGENGEAVAVPGILRGTFAARADSQLLGADVNARRNLLNTCNARAEVFAGYRFLSLRESLTLTEDITVIGPGGDRLALTDPVGTHVVVQDKFATRNYFNGGQIGGVYERRWGRWSATARGSVALGDTHQVLEIDGFQVRQQPGAAPMAFRGGLLAAGPNLGQFSSNHFSVVPEFTLNVGYFVTPNVRVYAGYNFLMWTSVIRPGDQIDHVVDLASVPNSPVTGTAPTFHPRPLFKQSDLVVNGIQFGMDSGAGEKASGGREPPDLLKNATTY